MTPNMDQAQDYSRKHHEDFIKTLSEFLKIKTISSDSTFNNDIRKGAQWLADYFKKVGAENIRILETGRHPVVFADLSKAGSSKPTILIYGHYDVQPPDPIELWNSEPFEPAVKDGKLFARGSSDMKGQLMVTLAAIESIQATGDLPVNFKFLVEGEEEIGSPSIQDFLVEHKDLFKSDFVLNLDAGMIAKDKPTIVYGLRGLAYFEIHVSGPAQDLHSGLFGGVVYNPIQVLCELIAGMKDKDGVIQLLGFYDDVLLLSEEEKKALAELGMDEDYFKKQTGAAKLHGEKGFSPVERVGARPTLDVNGIWGGYSGEGPKTVIPAKASAKLSTRLVPNQTPQMVKQQLEKYLTEHAPVGISWELIQLASDPASITDLDFYATRCLAESIEKVWGIPPVFQRGGGSIPIVSHMQKALGVESVLSGFSLPEDNIHSPNEHLDLDVFYKGIDTIVDYIFRIGDRCEQVSHDS
jgi:acetylornithine deacetylase/succinyl-diaminopimelate desuccinylase-like protein